MASTYLARSVSGRVGSRNAEKEALGRPLLLDKGPARVLRINDEHGPPAAIRKAGIGQEVEAGVVGMISGRATVGVELDMAGLVAVGAGVADMKDLSALVGEPLLRAHASISRDRLPGLAGASGMGLCRKKISTA